MEGLFDYQYLVRFEFIRVFSSKSATLREFFQQHPVSNKRIRDMKQIFIGLTCCSFYLLSSQLTTAQSVLLNVLIESHTLTPRGQTGENVR